MLDAHGQRPFVVALENLAVAVLGADANLRRPLHVVENSRYRQATFLGDRGSLARQNLRVDEHQGRVLLLREVDHQEAQLDVDLGRRQSDAGSGVHGLEHVVDQAAQLGIEPGHSLGPGPQARVGEFKNGSETHGRFQQYCSDWTQSGDECSRSCGQVRALTPGSATRAAAVT